MLRKHWGYDRARNNKQTAGPASRAIGPTDRANPGFWDHDVAVSHPRGTQWTPEPVNRALAYIRTVLAASWSSPSLARSIEAGHPWCVNWQVGVCVGAVEASKLEQRAAGRRGDSIHGGSWCGAHDSAPQNGAKSLSPISAATDRSFGAAAEEEAWCGDVGMGWALQKLKWQPTTSLLLQ